MAARTEDQVRDDAKRMLGLDDDERNVKQGTGQITTFNQLGFKGVPDKPDGWYLPDNTALPAIVLETKKENEDIYLDKWRTEVLKNCNVIAVRYTHVIGILTNGVDVRVFKDFEEIENNAQGIQHKKHYLSMYSRNTIDKQRIFLLTRRINDCLHVNFGIKNLYHRMIFTACALVGERYGANLKRIKDMGYSPFHTRIHTVLAKSLEKDRNQNSKIDLLLDVYSEIKMNSTDNQEAINDFIDWVVEISDCIHSDYWNGEDVMGIFFNEFNRYKSKADSGQIFTPEHITSFMYRLVRVTKDDNVLDAACGSGGFLVKSMSNMITESGGINTAKAAHIKREQLFGIEFDREIFALACANMLIHKDGKTNLTQLDSRTDAACEWIEHAGKRQSTSKEGRLVWDGKGITKVLMNPPFETKYGCLTIVKNVLDSVSVHTKCAFILPDKKLEKDKGRGKKIIEKHTLKKVIKLPEETFREGVSTSIFIFEAGVPQKNKEIFTCYIPEDGLESVKNQGRQDIRDRWPSIEDKWVDIIEKQVGDESIAWVKPNEHLSYQMPEKPFEIAEEDFTKTSFDYLMFEHGINVKDFTKQVLQKVLYSSEVSESGGSIRLVLNGGVRNDDCLFDTDTQATRTTEPIDVSRWQAFKVGELFEKLTLKYKPGDRPNKTNDVSLEQTAEFDLPLVNAKNGNNGIMYYGRSDDFDHANMTLDIVQNGASAVGNVYAEIGETGVLEDAYLIKLRYADASPAVLKYLATVVGRCVKQHFNYDHKCTWPRVKEQMIKLPAAADGTPDWAHMEAYMEGIELKAKASLQVLESVIAN